MALNLLYPGSKMREPPRLEEISNISHASGLEIFEKGIRTAIFNDPSYYAAAIRKMW